MRHQIYFAYGSNLHLRQMAKRCPESRLLGIARLHGFRWQINQRGYANVVAEDGGYVDGICYLLSNDDEQSLDRSEGVQVGAYEKKFLEIEIICKPAALVGRDVAQIVHDGSLELQRPTVSDAGSNTGDFHSQPSVTIEGSTPSDGLHRDSQPVEPREESGTLGQEIAMGKTAEMVSALVYLSTTFTEGGYPGEEYMSRLDMGIDDAVAIGISREFTNSILMTCLEALQNYMYS